MATVAVIGGSAAWELLQKKKIRVKDSLEVKTPFGIVSGVKYVVFPNGVTVWFISRHGIERYEISAPFVNYRANIYALKELGVERIIAWSGPGSIHPEKFQPGDFVLPDDLIDETKNRPTTFFEGKGWGFIRSNPAFCTGVRKAIAMGLDELGVKVKKSGIYVCTEGPRLETAAEIRKFSIIGGDLVGMTLVPEAFLARELEICYAPLCYVTNFAEGVTVREYKTEELFGGMLTTRERSKVRKCVELFPKIIEKAVKYLTEIPRDCVCPASMDRYKKEGILGKDWHEWL